MSENLLNPKLVERLKLIYSKEDFERIIESFGKEKNYVTFRVNFLNSSISEITENLKKLFPEKKFEEIKGIPGCFIIFETRESEIWETEIFKSGKIYLQSISSQIPVFAMFSEFINFENSSEEIIKKLHGKNWEGIKILDATAAPGGKTSQIYSLTNGKAEIYAFEKNKIRFEKMIYNFKKQNAEKVISINDDILNIGEHISEEKFFDFILVDAPCSGEGIINFANPKSFENRNEEYISKNYKLQKNIVSKILPYLKENGKLIYATCTLSPEENEGIAHFTFSNFSGIKSEKINLNLDEKIKTLAGIKSFGKYIYKKEIINSIRILPGKFNDGFFVGKFCKI